MEAADEAFWSQFWSESVNNVQDIFTLIPAAEIRALREESPSNLATLCYKAVEKLVQAAESGCRTATEQQTGELVSFGYCDTVGHKCVTTYLQEARTGVDLPQNWTQHICHHE